MDDSGKGDGGGVVFASSAGGGVGADGGFAVVSSGDAGMDDSGKGGGGDLALSFKSTCGGEGGGAIWCGGDTTGGKSGGFGDVCAEGAPDWNGAVGFNAGGSDGVGNANDSFSSSNNASSMCTIEGTGADGSLASDPPGDDPRDSFIVDTDKSGSGGGDGGGDDGCVSVEVPIDGYG